MADGDFKSSTIFAVGSAVAATIGLLVLIYKEVLLPTHTLNLQNQINAQTAETSALKAKIEPLEKANISQKEQIGVLQTKLRELQSGSVFVPGNPFPIGYSAIRFGQPISDVEKVYPADSIDKGEERGFWTVKLDHPVLSSAVYYFTTDKQQRSFIYQISFHFRRDPNSSIEQDTDALIARMTQVLGPPASNPRQRLFLWNAPDKTHIYVINYPSITIAPEPIQPGGWPRS